jgi:NDP-sugar pyrophosphorylase family protein
MALFHEFFSLQGFRHSTLFSESLPIWEALHLLRDYLSSYHHKIEVEIPTSSFIKGENFISIGKGTVIDPGVFIQGPCIIGEDCEIRHGSFLRGNVILGNRCVIGNGAELKNTILMDGVSAAHLCYLGDSILGSHVNIGAGVKCANLRLDRSEISIIIDGQKVNTGLKKLGAILGDEVQVGCNAVLNPGTVVGKKTIIHPLLNVGGTIPPYSQVKGSKEWIVEPHGEKILRNLRSLK